MAIAGVFIAFFSMVNEMGFGSAIVQRIDLTDSEMQSIFGFILFVSLILSLLLTLVSPLIASFYAEPILIPMLIALSIMFLLTGLAVVPRSLLLKKLKYKKIATIELISTLSGSLCTLIMALMGKGVWALVGGYLAIRLTLLISAHIIQPYIRLPRIQFSGMAGIFTFSGQITLSRILWYIYTSAAASLIVGKILGSEILGYYGVGLMIASLPMEKVGGIINQVAFPAFSSIQDNPALAGEHLKKAVRILSLVAIPVFWGISAISNEIVHVFLGEKWLSAIFPLQIIALVVPLRMVRNLFNPVLTGLGRADLDLKNEIVGVIFMPIAFLIAANWGLIGICLVWVIVFPVMFMINLETTRNFLNLPFSAIYSAMLRPTICGILMYIFLNLTKMIIPLSSFELINISILILTGIFVLLDRHYY